MRSGRQQPPPPAREGSAGKCTRSRRATRDGGLPTTGIAGGSTQLAAATPLPDRPQGCPSETTRGSGPDPTDARGALQGGAPLCRARPLLQPPAPAAKVEGEGGAAPQRGPPPPPRAHPPRPGGVLARPARRPAHPNSTDPAGARRGGGAAAAVGGGEGGGAPAPQLGISSGGHRPDPPSLGHARAAAGGQGWRRAWTPLPPCPARFALSRRPRRLGWRPRRQLLAARRPAPWRAGVAAR